MKTEMTISADDTVRAMNVLQNHLHEASLSEDQCASLQRVLDALGEADRIVIEQGTTPAITSTPTSAPTPLSAQRDEGAAPKLRVCVISINDVVEEVWFAPRSGLYRVLDLLGDPVDASLDKFSIEALEQYCDLVASKADTSGAVQWRFVPVMDALVS